MDDWVLRRLLTMHLPPAPFRCIAAIEAQPREIAPLSGLGKKHMQAKKHIQLGRPTYQPTYLTTYLPTYLRTSLMPFERRH